MGLVCDVCGGSFDARTGARYCSGRCRTIAYRQRQQLDRPARRRPPLDDAIYRTLGDLRRLVDGLDRLTKDDRIPQWRRDAVRVVQARNVLGDAARRLDEFGTRLEGQPSHRRKPVTDMDVERADLLKVGNDFPPSPAEAAIEAERAAHAAYLASRPPISVVGLADGGDGPGGRALSRQRGSQAPGWAIVQGPAN